MPTYRCPNCGRFCRPVTKRDPTCGACLPPLSADEDERHQPANPAANMPADYGTPAFWDRVNAGAMAATKRTLDRFFFGG